jgi:hypothetical protein
MRYLPPTTWPTSGNVTPVVGARERGEGVGGGEANVVPVMTSPALALDRGEPPLVRSGGLTGSRTREGETGASRSNFLFYEQPPRAVSQNRTAPLRLNF